MAVVLFHAEWGGVSGGYVGVDVFFVISGFLITRLLWSELKSTGDISFKRFYQRRILRLAPALIGTMLASALVFPLLMPPSLSSSLVGAMLSALASISNFWMAEHSSYFADNTANPVLHTWSLSVEEQFYLSFPVLLWALYRRWPVRLVWALAGLTLVSWAASGLAVHYAPSQAFYFPWFRAWELLMGSLAAVVTRRPRHPALSWAFSLGGLAAIGWATFGYTRLTVFPGLSATLPVVGTVAVILASGQRNWVNWTLASAPSQWLGKISYSVYLVHWPVLCLVSKTLSLASTAVRIAVPFLCVALGWASWRWIESRWRVQGSGQVPPRVFPRFATAIVLTGVLVALLQQGGQWAWERQPEALTLTAALNPTEDLFRAGTCEIDSNTPGLRYFDQQQCLKVSPNSRNLLIMGDSHAANLWSIVVERNPQAQIQQATATGCRPLLNAQGTTWCKELMQYVFDTWLVGAGKTVDHVLLAGRWELNELASLQATVAYLRRLGKSVTVVGPTPEFYMAVPLMLGYEVITGLPLSKRMTKTRPFELDRVFAPNFNAHGPETQYYSLVERLCSGFTCMLQVGETPIWFDRNHFTAAGARLALRELNFP